MEPVTIAELESDLRGYLKKVRNGEEVLIKIRNKPVAKIVSLSNDDEITDIELEEYIKTLAAKGKLRLPKVELTEENWHDFWLEDLPDIPVTELLDAVRTDREKLFEKP
jgi:prevent-host-death family protein